jgi:rhodanese-related sulfurtransferase
MFSRLIALTVVLCSGFAIAEDAPASKPATPSSAPKIAPAEFEKLALEPDTVVLDVRTPKEFAQGHIVGAVNIDYKSKEFAQKVSDLDKKKTYLVYCAVGGRSTGACEKLSKMDFPHLYNLDGGITRWEREGKKLEKE